jgi:hypothetical protein
LKNPVPETLAGHELRAITGVFGVLFQLLGNFFKNNHLDYLDQLDHQGHQEKIFSATEKNPKNPKYPVFASRPREIDASPGLAKKF